MRPLLLFVALAAAGAMPFSLRAAEPASKVEVARYAEQLLADTYASDGPGAALLIARGDEVLYRGSRGHADVDADTPLSPDALFRIGSVTKQFAAAGLLKLIEAGKVSLEDPLSKYVTDYPNGAKISVRQLLDHTSGVKSYTDIPGVMDGPIQKDVDTAQLIDTFKDEKPDFAPGEAWAYNNSGYVLVGAVIEAASGQPWHEYLEQALFEPLGLVNTGYGHDPAIVARHVRGYSFEGDKAVPAKILSMTQPHAAGALVSSVDDLLKWNRALHEGRVLKSATYQQMITPAGKAADAHYGFGLSIGKVRGSEAIAHGGGIFGFSSYLLYLPATDISVAILHNSDGGGEHAEPEQLARKLAAMSIGDPYPAATPIAIDPAALREYEGVFRIDDKTTRVLRVVDGKLTGQRTGGARAELMPIAKDTFLYDDGFNRFDIQRDGKGKVTGMRFYRDGEGEGVVVARSNEPLPVEAVAMTLPRAALDRVAGTYSANGMTLKVFVEAEALRAQLGGQPAFELAASSPTSFSVAAVGAALEFAPATGAAQSMTLKQGGAVIEFKRTVD
ncbi:MAG: serine hydrolase [Lysobacter sp.]